MQPDMNRDWPSLQQLAHTPSWPLVGFPRWQGFRWTGTDVELSAANTAHAVRMAEKQAQYQAARDRVCSGRERLGE